MTPHSIPVFFKNAGIGLNKGVVSPQIRGFDVFYTSPIIVGFHVLGSEIPCVSPSVEFDYIIEDEYAPQVVGFYCFSVNRARCNPIELEIKEDENFPQVLGFYAFKNLPSFFVKALLAEEICTDGPAIRMFHGLYVSDPNTEETK